MAADKIKKIVNGKKNSKGTVETAAVESSPTRVSRRNAATPPAKSKSPQRTASSPSPAARKVLKKKPASVKKNKKTEVETETESEEAIDETIKTIPLVSKSSKSSKSQTSTSKLNCKKMICGYLIFYNSVSAMAWAFLLLLLAKSFFIDSPQNHQILFTKTGLYLAYLQSFALLEVVHAALGWVRSGVISNVIQIASRLFVIWVAGVMGNTGKHWAYAVMALAWALSDLTRYTYYLSQLTEVSAPFLKWARYNFFLVLYPVGTLGEAILIFLARLKWSDNILLSYGLLTVLAIYTPGFLYMYSHMLQQRAKHFSAEPETPLKESPKQRKLKSK